MKKVLCVCSRGKTRSKYLSEYLTLKGYDTRYGGIEDFNDDNSKLITEDDVSWADIIIIVREKLEPIFREKFKHINKRIIVLDVPNNRIYAPNQLKEADEKVLNAKWVHPNLRKAIKHYLPL